MNEIPVYLFTGFMDSGKTSLIKDTLFEQGFAKEGKSLVICCEDGDAEFTDEELEKSLDDLELEDKIEEENKNNRIPLRINHNIESEKILKNKIKKLPEDKIPIIIAGGSFNAKNRVTQTTEAGIQMLEELIQKIDNKKVYFVIGHKMEGYEKAIIDISKKLHKKFEIYAIIPKMVSTEEANKLMDTAITGIRISTENEGLGIYKSFNYEIFERRSSVVIAFDGNSPVSNLIQEAKNGKGKSKIYVNEDNYNLRVKAKTLQGYVTSFKMGDNIINKILEDNIELI